MTKRSTLSFLLLALLYSACGQPPKAGSAALALVSGAHTYTMTFVGDGAQLSAALLGVSQPSGTYQLYLPSGGGTYTVGPSGATLTVTDVSANPQVTLQTGYPVTVTVKRDGVQVGAPILLNTFPSSYNWGYL